MSILCCSLNDHLAYKNYSNKQNSLKDLNSLLLSDVIFIKDVYFMKVTPLCKYVSIQAHILEINKSECIYYVLPAHSLISTEKLTVVKD
jgi:hypothetical protein